MPHHGQNPFVSVILSRPGAALRRSRGSQGSQRSPDPPKATGGGRTEPRAWCPCFHLVLPRFLVWPWGTSCNCLLLASAKPVPFLVPVELRRRMCPAPSAFGKCPPGPAGSPFSVCFELLAAWPPQWPVFLARVRGAAGLRSRPSGRWSLLSALYQAELPTRAPTHRQWSTVLSLLVADG